jgi:tRNA threonylcarbamoyladenosine modification (KEOPS) complex Cgi121 subunit
MVHTAGIKGSGWFAAIGGFSGASVGDVDKLLARVSDGAGTSVFQLFDADRVAGWRHLLFAAVNAVKAFEAGTAVSRGLAMEVLLYASCVDQILQALDVTGVSPSTERVALLVMSESRDGAAEAFERISRVLGRIDDVVLRVDSGKLEALKGVFGISDRELEAVGSPAEEALTWLIVERGALLPLRK